jgi:DNA-binding transcriptional MerR regulator
VGRVALFDDSHVSRLKMITSMLDRGYTSAHIHELLEAWERGGDLSDVLGLEKLVRPWAADQPTTMTLREVRELAGDRASLDRLVADGLVELRSKDAVVRRPMLLQAFAEMRRYGMSMTVAIEVHERVTPLLDEVSRILVEAGATQVAELVPAPEQLSDRAVADLVAMLLRIRTVAMDSATATLAHAIEQRIEDMLGAYLASLAGDPPATRGAG